jgi:hypothetical protein
VPAPTRTPLGRLGASELRANRQRCAHAARVPISPRGCALRRRPGSRPAGSRQTRWTSVMTAATTSWGPGNHVLVNARFALQPPDESAQGLLAAVELSRLGSELGELTARRCRLVANARSRHLLAGLGAKPSKLPVDLGRMLRHKLKATKRPPPALGNGAKCMTARGWPGGRSSPGARPACPRLSREAAGSCGSAVEATNRSRAQQPGANHRSPSGQATYGSRWPQLLAPYKQEVARSSRAPPIVARSALEAGGLPRRPSPLAADGERVRC